MKNRIKNKMKKFFFSKFTLIILSLLYIIFSIISFLAEYFIGHTDPEYAAILRITTLILDIIIIGAGILTWMQIFLRKKIRRLSVLRNNIIMILYLADTIAIITIFLIPYIGRLLLLFFNQKISYNTLFINTIMSIVVVFAIGFFIKRISIKIKKYGKRLKSKNSSYIN